VDQQTQFGRYELLEVLGEGGMARVFRAVRSGPMGFRKEVALKQILPHVARQEAMLRALINEARLGGFLRHRNIVEVYEFDQVDDTYFMAMEFVQGYTLDEVLARVRSRGFLPPDVVLQITAQICEGLQYAHDAHDDSGRPMQLVHRDLKPSNVILDQRGVVKLMDFGIARSEVNLFQTTAADVTKGTPVYMSPEQVKGEDLDRRSDLFSLASVIVEMITGEVAFSGTQLYQVLQKVANADTSSQIDAVARRFPPLVPVLERAFQVSADDRHDDAAQMGEALAAIQIEPTTPLGPWLEQWMAGPSPETSPTVDAMPAPTLARATGTAALIGDSHPGPMGDAFISLQSGMEKEVSDSARTDKNWLAVGFLLVALMVVVGAMAAWTMGAFDRHPPEPTTDGDPAAPLEDADAASDEALDPDSGEALEMAPAEVTMPVEASPAVEAPAGEPEPVSEEASVEIDVEPATPDPAEHPPTPEDADAALPQEEHTEPSRPAFGAEVEVALPFPGRPNGDRQETEDDVPLRVHMGLESDEAHRRVVAARALADCQGKAASKLIDRLVREDHQLDVRRLALQAGLTRRTTADIRVAIWALKNDPSPDIRAEACRVLTVYGDRAALRPLCRALMGDPSTGVRSEAARALQQMGNEGCLGALRHQLDRETDPGVRSLVEAAIAAIEV
jgi:serine/threonine-protein kinase